MNRSFAVIGALLTVLSLAIDPFVQQIIGFDELQVQTFTNVATIPQALRYSKGIEIDIEAAGTTENLVKSIIC